MIGAIKTYLIFWDCLNDEIVALQVTNMRQAFSRGYFSIKYHKYYLCRIWDSLNIICKDTCKTFC